ICKATMHGRAALDMGLRAFRCLRPSCIYASDVSTLRICSVRRTKHQSVSRFGGQLKTKVKTMSKMTNQEIDLEMNALLLKHGIEIADDQLEFKKLTKIYG